MLELSQDTSVCDVLHGQTPTMVGVLGEIEHSLVEIERAPSLDWIRPFQEPYPKQGAQYVKAIVGPPSGQE